MATHSSVLAWRIPGTGEPGGLLSMGSHRVGLKRLSSSGCRQGNKDPICRATQSKKTPRIWIKSLTPFSFVLCLVSLAHRMTAETLHLMPQNKVLSAKWLCRRRTTCRSCTRHSIQNGGSEPCAEMLHPALRPGA